jgi:hypothetical protein
MPRDHELRLMLVNTLRKVSVIVCLSGIISDNTRKDLERPEIPYICLALDNIIKFSTEELVPAIQLRLRDLLQHNSSVCYSFIMSPYQNQLVTPQSDRQEASLTSVQVTT